MAAKPLGNTFLFAFLQETANGSFVAKNKGRIIVSSHQAQDLRNQGDTARWARVLAVGPRVKDFKNGDIVLIAPGKWTMGFVHDDVKIWKSDDAWVLALGKDESVAYDYNYAV